MLNLVREKEISKVNEGEIIFSKSNKAFIRGLIKDDIEFDHMFYGEKFYKTRVAVKRNSGVIDYIPIVISERKIDLNQLAKGVVVEISGQFRSYRYTQNQRSRLELYIFVRTAKILNQGGFVYKNMIFLDGYIYKTPHLRMTSKGNRFIVDLLITLDKEYEKSNYIPAIAWGRNAYYASQFEEGTRIQLVGRIQSRIYKHKREIYEISITDLEKFNQ